MNVLITGANGYIGNELFSLLNKKYKVKGLFGSKDADLTNIESVKKIFHESFDVVIHCAAKGRYNHLEINDLTLNDNLRIFLNLCFFKSKFKKFINIGSGAEFNIDQDINNVLENEIFQRQPESSYGLSKNVVSRLITGLENFYTLRLFGCISNTLPQKTLMYNFVNKIKNNQKFDLVNDRYFDFFTIDDLVKVIDYYINSDTLEKDINLTYNDKIKLSEFLNQYCELHNYDKNLINIKSSTQINYTGNNRKLNKLKISLSGLDKTLKDIQ